MSQMTDIGHGVFALPMTPPAFGHLPTLSRGEERID
jgi:hypothetical protein